jgi:DNA-binding transcriptional ArsR family regulator
MLTKIEIAKNRKFLNDSDHHFAATMKALSDINRFRIVRMVITHPKISISMVAKVLRISLPLASLHVKVLVNALLLVKTRSGKNILLNVEHRNPLLRALAPAFNLSIKNNSINNKYVIPKVVWFV